MVLIPLARKHVDSPMQGMLLVRKAAQRFLPVAWASIFLLAVTGIYLATDHWDVSVGDFFSGESHFIRVLQVKTVLAALVIILSLTHDFVLGPWVMNKLEAARATSGPPPVIPVKKMILMIARVNLIMVLGNPVPGGISDSTVDERFNHCARHTGFRQNPKSVSTTQVTGHRTSPVLQEAGSD